MKHIYPLCYLCFYQNVPTISFSRIDICDIFYVFVLEDYLYPLRWNIIAMCYAFKQRSYCRIYVFKLDILLFLLVTILCVHVSLWMYIIMIVVYLETYTHEKSYMSYWYPIGSMSILLSLFTYCWLRKEFALWVLAIFSKTYFALIFIKDFRTSCFIWRSCYFLLAMMVS